MENRTIVGGPCIVKAGAHWYETAGDVTVTPATKTRVITSSLRGPVSRRVVDRTVTVAFTPLGRLTSLAAYYPFGPSDLGALVAPAVDTPVIVWGADGKQYTYLASALSAAPDLILSANAGPFGAMTFTAMGALTKATGAADSMFTYAAAPIAGYDYDLSTLYTPGYKLELLDGAAVVETVDGKEGFTFKPGYKLDPVPVDAYGTVNFRLSAVDPSLSLKPAGPDVAKLFELLKFQGAGAAAIGGDGALGLKARVSPVAGDGVVLTFADCQLAEADITYGEGDRLGPWTLNPVAVDGEDLFTLGLTTDV